MRPLLAGVLLLAATPVSAHDFWMDAGSAPARSGAPLTLTFRVGTASEVEDWTLRPERVVALRSYGPRGGVTDHQAGALPGRPGKASVVLNGDGTHIVSFETTPVESDLPAAEFNDYLDHEGLPAVKAWRAANGKTGERGRETYARRAKALVQVGSRATESVSRPIGMSLEIVPEHNPVLHKGTPLPVRLLFRGKPLAGAMVSLERLDARGEPQKAQSDVDGRVILRPTPAGQWKIATVWSVPIEGNLRAEFDTLFASLTFGY